MTVIEAIDRARVLLSEPLSATRSFPDDDSGFWTDTELLGFLNTVQQEVAQEIVQAAEDYFITQTSIDIVAETQAYSLASDVVRVRRVEDNRYDPPIEIVPTTLNEQFRNRHFPYLYQGSSGVPAEYYIRGSEIVFNPTPGYTQNSGVVVHYVKHLPDFTTTQSTATIAIPTQWQRTVVWGIVKYALFKQQTPDNMAENEYTKGLLDIRNQADGRQAQTGRRVRRTKGNLRGGGI